MSVEFLETLAADLLKDNHLVCPAFIIENGSLDYCALYIRSTYLHGSVICDEKHLLELHISTLGIGKPLHKDLIASFYFKLLTCNVYDCVHK